MPDASCVGLMSTNYSHVYKAVKNRVCVFRLIDKKGGSAICTKHMNEWKYDLRLYLKDEV